MIWESALLDNTTRHQLFHYSVTGTTMKGRCLSLANHSAVQICSSCNNRRITSLKDPLVLDTYLLVYFCPSISSFCWLMSYSPLAVNIMTRVGSPVPIDHQATWIYFYRYPGENAKGCDWSSVYCHPTGVLLPPSLYFLPASVAINYSLHFIYWLRTLSGSTRFLVYL